MYDVLAREVETTQVHVAMYVSTIVGVVPPWYSCGPSSSLHFPPFPLNASSPQACWLCSVAVKQNEASVNVCEVFFNLHDCAISFLCVGVL
jgi:hypothetical protein